MAHWFQLGALAMFFGFALAGYFASTSSALFRRQAHPRSARPRVRRHAILPTEAPHVAPPQ
jgi:hypothetical protein